MYKSLTQKLFVQGVFTHPASSYWACILEQQKVFFVFFFYIKSSTPAGLARDTNMANIQSCKKWSITKWLFTFFLLLFCFQVFNIRSAKPAVPEIPTTPSPTPFYKTTEGIITMASACVVVLLAVVTVLLWRKHAKKRYEIKTP